MQQPLAIEGTDIRRRDRPAVERVTGDLKKHWTACGQCFDCKTYAAARANGGRRQGTHLDTHLQHQLEPTDDHQQQRVALLPGCATGEL
jgi:hypothetical protein